MSDHPTKETTDLRYLRDDGTLIYNEPAEFDEAECEARGRADRIAGVGEMDGPYVAGLPLYAWERGWSERMSTNQTTEVTLRRISWGLCATGVLLAIVAALQAVSAYVQLAKIYGWGVTS